MSGYIIALLTLAIIVLAVRLVLISAQIRNMRRQLQTRMEEKTRQPLTIELLSKELNRLTASVNQCLQKSELSAIKSAQKEKEFKEMVASISHDLRTPLTAIKGNLQLLEQDTLTDRQQQKLSVVKRRTEEMAQLVERFWEYSYYSTSDRELKLEKINLTNLIAECISDYVQQIENKGFSVSYHQEKPIFIIADREYCLRILQNLIQNCINHSAGDIEIIVLQAFDNVELTVINPVSESADIDVQRIFDRFYTADKSRKKVSGLGLSIVALLAEKMGGDTAASMRDGVLRISIGFQAWIDKYS